MKVHRLNTPNCRGHLGLGIHQTGGE